MRWLAIMGYVLIIIGLVALFAFHLGPLPYIALGVGGILVVRWIMVEVVNRS
jgi:hypothetical protein